MYFKKIVFTMDYRKVLKTAAIDFLVKLVTTWKPKVT